MRDDFHGDRTKFALRGPRQTRSYLPARPGAFPLLPRFSIFLIFESFPRLPLLPRFSIFLIFDLFPRSPLLPRFSMFLIFELFLRSCEFHRRLCPAASRWWLARLSPAREDYYWQLRRKARFELPGLQTAREDYYCRLCGEGPVSALWATVVERTVRAACAVRFMLAGVGESAGARELTGTNSFLACWHYTQGSFGCETIPIRRLRRASKWRELS